MTTKTKKSEAKAPAAPKPTTPAKVEAYLLWDVDSPPFGLVASKEEGEESLRKHISQSGEAPADKRLVHVKEV